jgi:Na+-transporting NADH:ubiquinone oxidoreductase subunit C
VVLPIHGYGLWGTLYGFLSLEGDGNTVIGLGFYEHKETPGLGAEVDNPKWKAIWPGKKVYDDQGEVAVQVVKGGVDKASDEAIHQVDGLSGATLTSRGVENLLRFWLGDEGFGPFLAKLRAGEVQ